MSVGVGTPPVAAYFHALTRAVEEPDNQKLFEAAESTYAALTATEKQEAEYLIDKQRKRCLKHRAITNRSPDYIPGATQAPKETARPVEGEPSPTEPQSD